MGNCNASSSSGKQIKKGGTPGVITIKESDAPETPLVKNTSVFEDSQERSIKIVILGDSAEDKFEKTQLSTLGVDFKSITTTIDDQQLKLYLWDTAGQERFRSIAPTYYRDADCVLLVYDITEPDTLQHLESWITEIRSKSEGKNIIFAVVGNKIDLGDMRSVTIEEAESFAREHGQDIIVREVSAKSMSKQQLFVVLEDLVRLKLQK
ncbi:Ras-related protein Rab [Acrasis kona]|uniref:Ras-related protein Rab n=1 Tax=Acrasis kona TaxID=1008807 RepID=A0AAW2ZAU1_9EUKA